MNLNVYFAQLKRTATALDWIIESMVEKGAGSRSGRPKLSNVDQLKEEGTKICYCR